MSVDANAVRRDVSSTAGLILTPRPFAAEGEVSLHAMPDGMAILAMVELLEARGDLDPAYRPWLRVTAGDQRVPRELWASARPRPGVTLFVDVAPRGKSNAVRTILQIAVLALSAFAGYALGGVPGALAAAAINIGGMIAINAIAPIKQPDVAQRQPRYSLDGASNAARPHDAVPIVFGRRRIFPPRCANWFTQTIGNVVYLRQMFQPSVSWVDHASPRIGQTALESYDGVTIRWRTKPDEAIAPIWFNRTPAEDSLALEIKSSSGWVTRTAPLETDVLSIDVAFLSGLFETKESSGNPKNRSVTFEFRYGPKGVAPAAATACPFTAGGLKTYTRDKLESYREGYEWAVARGEYDVHIRRVSPDNSGNAKISDALTWVCLRAFRNEPAVRDLTGKPWIELELRASDQLQGVPQDFNFIATSIVPTCTAAGPGGLIASRNPADHYLAASYAPFSDVDLDEDERNFTALAAWRDTCEAEGWTCDLAEDGEVSVGELMQRISGAGRARPTLDFGALSVVVDWAKPLPRQMFTSRTVSGFQGEVTYPSPVHGLRVRFANEDKDYDADTITVFAQRPEGGYYDLTTATLYESVEIRDKTNADEVEWEGARLLAERIARPESFTFDQDLEYVTAVEGSRAWLQHHVALVGQVSARVLDIVLDPDNPAARGLFLDEVVVMEAGRAYDLAWRKAANAPLVTLTLAFNLGADDVVWLAAPVPADLPAPGDLVAVHEHALELLDVIVDSIVPKDGLRASITCVPYAPELQTVGDEPIPAYRTGASRPPGLGGAIVVRRTEQAIDKVIEVIGGAVDEAGKGLEGIADGTGIIGGRLVNDALTALDQNIIATTATALTMTVVNGETVEQVEQLQNNVGGNTGFIQDIKSIGPDGSTKSVSLLNSNGHVIGQVNQNDGTIGGTIFAGDYFGLAGSDPAHPKIPFFLNVLTDDLEITADIKLRGNLSIIDGSLITDNLADNSVTNRIRDAKSTFTHGTGFDVEEFSYTFTLPAPADVEVDGNCNFLDGGGNGPSYHSSAVKLFVNGTRVAINSIGGANAMQQLGTFGGQACAAGPVTVSMSVMTKPDDGYDLQNFRVRWFFK